MACFSSAPTTTPWRLTLVTVMGSGARIFQFTLDRVEGRPSSIHFFKIGPLAITALFLFKASGFLFFLVSLSQFLQRVLLGRLFRRLGISAAQRFDFERFATYLFFSGGLFIGLQSLGVNLSSLLFFGGAVGLGLGLQNVVSNFVVSLILLVEQLIRIGDRIEPGTLSGMSSRSRRGRHGSTPTTIWSSSFPTMNSLITRSRTGQQTILTIESRCQSMLDIVLIRSK